MVAVTFASVFIAAWGDRQSTWRGSLLLAAGMTAFGAILFHMLLGIPLPL